VERTEKGPANSGQLGALRVAAKRYSRYHGARSGVTTINDLLFAACLERRVQNPRQSLVDRYQIVGPRADPAVSFSGIRRTNTRFPRLLLEKPVPIIGCELDRRQIILNQELLRGGNGLSDKR
jgi:hypothetical protein